MSNLTQSRSNARSAAASTSTADRSALREAASSPHISVELFDSTVLAENLPSASQYYESVSCRSPTRPSHAAAPARLQPPPAPPPAARRASVSAVPNSRASRRRCAACSPPGPQNRHARTNGLHNLLRSTCSECILSLTATPAAAAGPFARRQAHRTGAPHERPARVN